MAGRKVKIDNVEDNYEYVIDIPLDDDKFEYFDNGYKSKLSEMIGYGVDAIYKRKGYYALLLLVSAIVVVLGGYLENGVYNPKDRNFLDDNLFSGNAIVASSEEIQQIVSNLEQEFGIEIEDEFIDEYCLLNAIWENPNLTDEEKNCFYKYIDMIKDNPYLNKEKAYSSLLNVDVSYKKRPLSYASNVEGVYIHDYESVGIFVEDEDNHVLGHEGIHTIFVNDEINNNLPVYFSEGMTELLNNEYLSSSPFVELTNYPFEVVAVKMLCELTSSDTVLKSFTLGDMSFIENEMVQLVGDRDSVVLALDALDSSLCKYEDELSDGKYGIIDNDGLMSSFFPVFRECLDAKYSQAADKISYYYNESLFLNIFEEDALESYYTELENYGVDRKAYFSSNLKSKNQINTLEYNMVESPELIINSDTQYNETTPVLQKIK